VQPAGFPEWETLIVKKTGAKKFIKNKNNF
jgi:hypothetical protein